MTFRIMTRLHCRSHGLGFLLGGGILFQKHLLVFFKKKIDIANLSVSGKAPVSSSTVSLIQKSLTGSGF